MLTPSLPAAGLAKLLLALSLVVTPASAFLNPGRSSAGALSGRWIGESTVAPAHTIGSGWGRQRMVLNAKKGKDSKSGKGKGKGLGSPSPRSETPKASPPPRASSSIPETPPVAAAPPSPAAAEPAAPSSPDWFEVGNAPDAVLFKYHASVTRGAFGRGMTVEDFMAVPELSEMIESGEMESPEVLAVWAQAVGGTEADVQQFVAAWRALESLFEFEDIVDGAEPVPEGSQIQVDDEEEALNPTAAAADSTAESDSDQASSNSGGSADSTSTAAAVLPSAAVGDWEFASQGAVTVLQPMVVASPFLAEPLADGDLSMDEVQALWAIHVGDPRASCDVEQFAQLWLAVDDLFEDDDDGDDEVDGSSGSAMAGNGDFTVLPNDDDDDSSKNVVPLAPSAVKISAAPTRADSSTGESNQLTGEALQEWHAAQGSSSSSSSSGEVTKAAVLACAFVAEPLADGDLLPEEVEALWASATGSASATTADAESFGRFWAAVEDLFEDEDDDEDDSVGTDAAAAGSGSASRALKAPQGLSGSALREWRMASAVSGGAFASKEAVLACDFVTEPLADGDLLSEEVELLWVEHVGAAAESADMETFGRFWAAVDDLFEDDDDEDEAIDAGNAGAVSGSAEDASLDLDGSYAACRAALVEALGKVPRKGLDASEQQRETFAKLCDELDRHPAQVETRTSLGPDDSRLTGNWELVYTSSSSFVFNEGFTGVAKTTPGGATFQSLTQRLTATRLGSTDALIVGDTTMVETLALGSGSREDSSGASSSVSDDGSDSGNRGGGAGLLSGGLVVTVDGSWELKRRVNLMAVDQAEAAVVGVTAQSLRYGPVEVRGDRVQVGWKSMRVLNGASLRCLEPLRLGLKPSKGDLRIMHGSAGPSSLFVFRRI